METTCIRNIKEDNLFAIPFISWKALQLAQFGYTSPFVLKLKNEEVLYADEIIRIVPKKRMTVFGRWRGKQVVAKLFYDKTHALRHIEKELAGLKTLTDHNIPTPACLQQDESHDKKTHILISERIVDGASLAEIWQNREHYPDVMHTLKRMMVELATQHVFGIVQRDIHLKNYLISEKKVYTLDGADISLDRQLLPKKMSMENLALFFSQFGVNLGEAYQDLFKVYAKARGWILKPIDSQYLASLVEEHNQQRWRDYGKKIYRNCTQFLRFKRWNMIGVIDRHYWNHEFAEFFSNPEKLFNKESNVILKQGRSNTVIKTTIGNQDFVIKRYNLKNKWHFLRRAFRPTRAYSAWKIANKLALFGVPTAHPVAFLEKRCLNLRSVSYSVLEYVPGMHANEFFSTRATDDENTTTLVISMVALLKHLAQLKITHGDLKLTNFLIHNNKPVLIDLDGSIEHHANYAFNFIYRKEIKRFLKNFIDMPYLQDEFRKKLNT